MVIKLTSPGVSSNAVLQACGHPKRGVDPDQCDASLRSSHSGIFRIFLTSSACENIPSGRVASPTLLPLPPRDREPLRVRFDEEHLERFPERVHSWNSVLQPRKPILKVRGSSTMTGSEDEDETDSGWEGQENCRMRQMTSSSPSMVEGELGAGSLAPPGRGQTAGLRPKGTGLRIKLVAKKRSRDAAFAL